MIRQTSRVELQILVVQVPLKMTKKPCISSAVVSKGQVEKCASATSADSLIMQLLQ